MTPSADHPIPTDEREDERLPLRPGCGGALLAVFAAAGILVWALVALAYILPTGTPRFPQQLGWDYYVLASALWGVGIGATGIFLILRRQRPHFAAPVILLLFCDIGVVLAPVWPVQALVLAVACAARAGKQRPRYRLGALVVGLLLLAGGCVWGTAARAGQELHSPGKVSATALHGSWHNVTGRGRLELGADGHFTADDIPATPDWGHPGSARISAAGTWAFTIDKADPVVTLTIAPDASTPGQSAVARLDVEAYGSFLVLCRWQNDADEACNSGFHR